MAESSIAILIIKEYFNIDWKYILRYELKNNSTVSLAVIFSNLLNFLQVHFFLLMRIVLDQKLCLSSPDEF